MKTLAKLLYVESDEEITDLVDRLRDLSLEDEVTFVVPERARSLQSAMSFRLLKRYADSYGKKVNLVSGDPRLQAMALEAGFSAFPSMAAYDLGSQVHQPVTGEEPPPARRTLQSGAGAVAGVATIERPRQAPVLSGTPRTTPAASTPSKPPLRSYRPYLIAAGVLALLALLGIILYLPTATATVSVSGTPLKQDITLSGAPGVTTGGDQFATQSVHASQSQSLPGTATGQQQVAAVKATGQVTFRSNCGGDNCTFTVPAGTDVSTDDGKHYVTQKDAPVRSSASVAVTATQAGAAANTPEHTIRSINNAGLLGFLASVDNPQPIGGGADARTATVIQQSDIDSVRDAYARDAVQQVTDQLNSKAQGEKLVLVGNGVQATATADHKAGDEVNGFTVNVTVAGDGIVFDDKAVKGLLKSALEHKLPSGDQLTSNQSLTYEVASSSADGRITLNGHASGFYTPIFREGAIRSYMKGLSPSKAHAFLQGLPNVVDARITQSPFGLPWLPLFSSRITLKIQEVAGSTSS